MKDLNLARVIMLVALVLSLGLAVYGWQQHGELAERKEELAKKAPEKVKQLQEAGRRHTQLSKNRTLENLGAGQDNLRSYANKQALADRVSHFVLAQGTTAAGAQHRVADQRNTGQGLHDLQHGFDHLHRAEHAQLDGGHRQVGDHGVGLGQHPVAVEDAEVGNVDGILHGQGGHCRCGVAALGDQGFDIRLEAGATTGVVAGKAEDYGARVGRFHGRRAYH